MNPQNLQNNISAKDRIIVALDVGSKGEALALIEELHGSVGGFKIGMQLFTAAGPEFVREITSAGHRVFFDLKYHDIPNTVVNAGIAAAQLGVWMFNVHALGGGEMMRRTINEVGEFCSREGLNRPLIIAVTLLTSSDANELSEIGIETDVTKQVVNLAVLTAKCGLDGVVASAQEARAIRNISGSERLLVVTPGIRPTSATMDDQKRVMTPKAALENGSDLLVIGRPITAASDKLKAINEIIDEIEVVLA